jgi:hypothetical protein
MRVMMLNGGCGQLGDSWGGDFKKGEDGISLEMAIGMDRFSIPLEPYAFFPRALAGRPPGPASFSSVAFTTKSITEVSTVTQCSRTSRCSDFGILVDSCTYTTDASLAIPHHPFFPQ